MQTVPEHISLEEVERRLVQRVPGVLSVHEFHIWQLAGDKIIASVHVRCATLKEYMETAGRLKAFFHDEGIHSTTIQPEYEDTSAGLIDAPPQVDWGDVGKSSDGGCALECAEDCHNRTCCGSGVNSRSVST